MAEAPTSTPSASDPISDELGAGVDALLEGAGAGSGGAAAAPAAGPNTAVHGGNKRSVEAGNGSARSIGMGSMPRPEEPGVPGDGALRALESVESLLAGVADDLIAAAPPVDEGRDGRIADGVGGVDGVNARLRSVAADLEPPDEGPAPPAGAKPAAGGADEGHADAAAVLAEVSREVEERVRKPAAAGPAGPEPTIDQLDEALADAAEDVLASDQGSERVRVPEAEGPATLAAPVIAGAAGGSAGRPAAPAESAAKAGGAGEAVVVAAGADATAPAGEPVPAAAVSSRPGLLAALGPAMAKLAAPLARAGSGLSPTARQTVSWLAVYTGLLAMGVWGYLLLKAPAALPEPTSEPTHFLRPGDKAPEPKHPAKPAHGAAAGHGKDDGHGHGHGAAKPPAGKGKPDAHAKPKADAHGKAKPGGHGKDAGHGAADGHGKAPAKKKPPAKKDAARKDAGHH